MRRTSRKQFNSRVLSLSSLYYIIQSRAPFFLKIKKDSALILLFPDVLDRLALLLQGCMSGKNVGSVELKRQSMFPGSDSISILHKRNY